ncbi:hypothetical protein ACIPWE_20110 [Streptomyces sp. NPDC090073]|uniref:hypothetical protein n=1 Tax=Streptomyces sp. NPDC090073 TaxID=3365936 RepID=UPI00380E9EAA
MSPEQLTDQPVGPAGDVFALGAVLAYTGTGSGPFGAGTPHVLHYRAVHEPPSLASLSPALREVVAACLAKVSDGVGHRLRRGRRGARPPGFEREAYKQRNTVERCIDRLEQWHGLAIQTDKLAIAYQAALPLAGILICLDPTPAKETEPGPQHRGPVEHPSPRCGRRAAPGRGPHHHG